MTNIAFSLGYGSGIDTQSLASDLTTAAFSPRFGALDARQTSYQAKISSLARLTSDFEGLVTSLEAVVAEGAFRTKPTVSDSSVLSVSLSSTSNMGAVSSSLTVNALATSQSIYSGIIGASSDPVGLGDLVLNTGSGSFTVTIDASNNSLTGLAAAINDSESGVTASIVNDAGGARLLLKGETGAANAFTVALGSGAEPSLGAFAFNGTNGTMPQGQAAGNAEMVFDGVAVSRASNTVDDLIPGVSLQLNKAAPGQTVQINGERQAVGFKTMMEDLAATYNQIWSNLASARKELGSDPTLRQFERNLTALTTTTLNSSGAVRNLSDVGLTTNRDGTLSLNSAKFDKAFAANPDLIEAMFSPGGGVTANSATTGLVRVMNDLKASVLGTDGTLTAINKRLETVVSDLAEQRLDLIDKRDAYSARMENQFGKMDSRLAALKATQSYLEQQIELWNSQGGN